MTLSDGKSCDRRGALGREGLSQADRVRPELDGGYFRPDERDLADLILFGQRFAARLKYYDADNIAAGNFAAFFASDMTAALAALAKLPVAEFRAVQADLGHWLGAEPSRDAALLVSHAQLWLHLAPALLQRLADPLARLPKDHPLRRDMAAVMARSLAGPLHRVVSIAKGGMPGASGLFAGPVLQPGDFNLNSVAGDPRYRLGAVCTPVVTEAADLAALTLPAAWFNQMQDADWAAFHSAIPEDRTPFEQADPVHAFPEFARVEDLLGYGLLTQAIGQIYDALEALRLSAVAALTDALESHATHAPQMGLWLAFLQLFRHAQADLNRFTDRHLEFYLRDVLGLKPRAPQPDSAHVVFELAKGQGPTLLETGTALRAGKDAAGNPVRFALTEDLVVSPAKLTELAGIRMQPSGKGVVPLVAPVLASADGVGEVDLPPDALHFPPFGPQTAPPARVGFAVADRALFLREGQRKIILRAHLEQPVATETLTGAFRARLSGAEGWLDLPVTARFKVETIEVDPFGRLKDSVWTGTGGKGGKSGKRGPVTVKGKQKQAPSRAEKTAPDKTSRLTMRAAPGWKTGKPGRDWRPRKVKQYFLELTLDLGAEAPAILPVTADLHGEDHAPGLPVAEILYDFDDTGAEVFTRLRDLEADKVTIRTEVTGLRNLTVVADGGVADVSKPFTPFGPRPEKGATFHVGSAEIFAKPMQQVTFQLGWETAYSSGGYFLNTSASAYSPAEFVLARGQWVQAGTPDPGLNSTARQAMASTGAREIDGLAEMTEDNPPLTPTSKTGFFRFDLGADFGHDRFASEQARALIAIASDKAYYPGPGVNTRNPSAQSFASVLTGPVIAGSPVNKAGELPREPFVPELASLSVDYVSRTVPVAGFAQMGPFGSRPADDGRLFPDLGFEGAILIGVDGFEGPARLSFLMQVLPGSGDPLLVRPALRVDLLRGNDWTRLKPQDVDDRTANLTRSGLLAVALPQATGAEQTLYPDGLTWLRLSVAGNAAAVNHLLGVHLHAARAEFTDQGNDPARLDTPLPAETIARLDLPRPAIKTVLQPYAGFGGRPEESFAAFRTRASERLRHKNRAVTPWDYEALVLEAFPQLHRAKCLPLTRLMRDGGRVLGEDEQRPGAVTVVCVPKLDETSPADPLRPYVDTGTLGQVDAFLRRRISPFVQLEVANPRLEEVELDFTVQFRDGIDDIAFRVQMLEAALIAHLTPWSGPDGAGLNFGGKLWKSALVDFLDSQPEVDFVTDVKLFHQPDIRAGVKGPEDLDVVTATTARSILVSARRHTITPGGGS